jgi:hypothetical protein
MINFKNWDFSRIFKLLAGITGLTLAIIFNWVIIGILGTFFLFQAIMNTRCGVCNTSSCTINRSDTEKK